MISEYSRAIYEAKPKLMMLNHRNEKQRHLLTEGYYKEIAVRELQACFKELRS
jgi:hypothetical protein